MLVGGLASAGADQSAIADAIHSLDAGAEVSFEPVKRRGIGALKFHVKVAETKKHRHLRHILEMIDKAALPGRTKAYASAVFQRLGEAEALVHQVGIEKVHFHEVGAADSIADIVGACLAFELLGVARIVCSPVNVGGGTVETEHGTLPVPAPATASLLIDKPIYSRGPAMELTTPTGAAVAVTLAESFGAMPPMRIQSTGYGAGGRDLTEHANVLRVLIGEDTRATEAITVSVIEANIDDSTPQVLGFALERLMEAGALDASLQHLTMKKSRPGVLLQVIAKPEDRERLVGILLAETSTLGVRFHEAERRVQEREWVEVRTSHGPVRIKVSEAGSFAPEYEDCRKLALSTGTPLRQIIAEAGFQFLNRENSKPSK
jgi:uncharacterized protein (TIGR00299 family) protein